MGTPSSDGKAFFPNAPSDSLSLEARLRRIARSLPEEVRYELYHILSEAHASFLTTTFTMEDGLIFIDQGTDRIAFPRPVPLINLSHIICGYREWLRRKYTLPGFVEIEAGDVVVDCGAYVGGFSLSAVQSASQLHAFEPNPGNFECLSRNLSHSRIVRLNEVALYSRPGRGILNLSASAVEHSLLKPDDGAIVGQLEVELQCLQNYCHVNGITKLDFLKLEAEGVEIEIFEGLGDMRPRKLAIDVSPERDGQSPAPHFQGTLSSVGYQLKQRGNVLFARLSE